MTNKIKRTVIFLVYNCYHSTILFQTKCGYTYFLAFRFAMTKISYHTSMKSGLKTIHASQFILVSKAIFCLSLQLLEWSLNPPDLQKVDLECWVWLRKLPGISWICTAYLWELKTSVSRSSNYIIWNGTKNKQTPLGLFTHQVFFHSILDPYNYYYNKFDTLYPQNQKRKVLLNFFMSIQLPKVYCGDKILFTCTKCCQWYN